MGMILDSWPYSVSSLFLVPLLVCIYWTFKSVSVKSRNQLLFGRLLAGIEGYGLAKTVETHYFKIDKERQKDLLETYYFAKYAYEKVFSSALFPKLRDIVDNPPSIQKYLGEVELEVLKKRFSNFDA